MASRNIVFDFIANTTNLEQGLGRVSSGMDDAQESTGGLSGTLERLKPAAKVAAVAAAAAAAAWAVEGISMATTANRIDESFERVFGSSDALSHEVTELAGHMGLAEAEAKELLASAGALGQSMGMTAAESEKFAAEMFLLAGDMAAANPEIGTAADAMEALLKASNGSTRGLQAWDVSIKSAEVTARALANTGKESSAALTQQEKALATLQLTQEKTASSQGVLNEKMADGSTKYREAGADIEDMQTEVGQALMPIKRLALEGLLILAEVLKELSPAIEAVGQLLGGLFEVIKPLLPILSLAAKLLGALAKGFNVLLQPIVKVTQAVGSFISAIGRIPSKIKNPFSGIRVPSFHSGGTVPGAAGSLQPVMAQGGEEIGRPGASGGGAPTTVINITVQAGLSSPMDTARKIADLLTEYTANQGPINVKVRG